MTKAEQQICDFIAENFPDMYDKKSDLPKVFKGSEKIKAIVIGADPTYKSGKSDFQKVFKLEMEKDSPFFRPILNNIKQVNLNLNNIYAQNLVRNYCEEETSKNKDWSEMAKYWIDIFKKDLEQFSKDIPVFVTAWIILKALTNNEVIKQLSPNLIYEECRFIKPNENLLGRTIIPLFRHPRYQIKSKKWIDYKNTIIKQYN